MTYTAVTRQRITEVERAIRPFIRWTPLVRTSASSMRRRGAPSRSSSDDLSAGSQYCRISWPIAVPGPTFVSSAPSIVVVMGRAFGCVAGHRIAGRNGRRHAPDDRRDSG
jgi:hypothetical protein